MGNLTEIFQKSQVPKGLPGGGGGMGGFGIDRYIRSSFFAFCRSVDTLVCLFTNDLETDKRSFIWNLKLC